MVHTRHALPVHAERQKADVETYDRDMEVCSRRAEERPFGGELVEGIERQGREEPEEYRKRDEPVWLAEGVELL
jgi:hypothetical protein